LERKAVQICNEDEKLTSDLCIEKRSINVELGKIIVILQEHPMNLKREPFSVLLFSRLW
tara:strand:- start:256 stop:432 length:177 start_codon:yes stop_codon:yes gene_type:complete